MAVFFATFAFAGSQAGVMNVTTSVVAQGSFQVYDLAFPTYDVNEPNYTVGGGQIDVWITAGSPFGISLDAGNGFNGYFGPRQMIGAVSGTPLNYEIFDPILVFPWGSWDYAGQFGPMGDLAGVPNPYAGDLVYGMGAGIAAPPISLYPQGAIDPQQPVPPDTYSDVVNVLLVY
ncbi:spore coat protein U domain-containing protein [Thermodesulfobacteriota bacterium]